MSTSISLSESDVLTALRAFLLGLFDCPVEKSQTSNVPMPKGGFIEMTPLFSKRLSTNVNTFDTVAETKITELAEQFTIQIDFYGLQACEWATIVTALFRDEYACDQFPSNIQPLHADDPRRIEFVNGEEQYESRWMVEANVQYNPVITTSMTGEFFDTVDMPTINPVGP